jgi:hypothetical protein
VRRQEGKEGKKEKYWKIQTARDGGVKAERMQIEDKLTSVSMLRSLRNLATSSGGIVSTYARNKFHQDVYDIIL